MSRFALFVLAALVLAPAGLAVPRTDADRRRGDPAEGARDGTHPRDQLDPQQPWAEAARVLREAVGRGRTAHSRDGRQGLFRTRVIRLDRVLEAHRAVVSVEGPAFVVGRREPALLVS